MAGRIRTTKKLAQRIDRGYFRRLFPIPFWRRIFSLLVVGVCLVWLGFHAAAHDESPYSSGPLTVQHAILGGNCASCHGQGLAVGRRIKDQACLSCHDGPVHNAAQTFSPACVECHVEHKGTERLIAAQGSQLCTSCHSNLHTRSGKTQVAANIESFTHGHPEFSVLRSGAADPAAIKFNHKAHVGDLSQKCGDCHHAGGGVNDGAGAAGSPRGVMRPVGYQEQCSTCHPLSFDDKIPDAAPHDKPEVVHEFVTRKLREYIAGHASELGKAGTPRNAAEWVRSQVEVDEKQLWTTTCDRCHTLHPAAGAGLPSVPETKISHRWFTKAKFDHSAHQELQCVSCHANAASSTKASDVLLPGIRTCQECHGVAAKASGECSTCHLYHDWTKGRPVDGKFTIKQL
ncbi:MAG TPA: cytochrome c3 family protein [Bryobacteraceae bacterium]|nr:cytochrome c3 family protein [Bryobacteraceae bacterium]